MNGTDAGGASADPDDPSCPECGEPIGQTATYCMHCSADLTEEQAAADADGDEAWEQTETVPTDSGGRAGTESDAGGDTGGQLLDPEGLVDDTLTVAVGIVGGVVVGVVGTVVLAALTGSAWTVLFGLVAWLGATASLVRRRTVQSAVARTGYAVAVVLLLVPVVAFSPIMDVEGGLGERGGLFVALLVFVAVPAGVAAAVGWVASRFVPDRSSRI
jgi:hypothetical protein